jgi:hypothetical protein
MLTLVPATKLGVEVPVPPLATAKVPPSVTAPVVAVEGVSPVDPALKVVTPPAVPFEAAVMRPWASTVRLVLVYTPGVTAVSASAIVPVEVIGPPVSPVLVFIRVTALPEVMVPHPEAVYPSNTSRSVLYRIVPTPDEIDLLAVGPTGTVKPAAPGTMGSLTNAMVGLLAPSPSVTAIWLAVPVMVLLAMAVPLTMANMPVPVALAMAAATPVNWKVGSPATPLPLLTDTPDPLVAKVRAAKVLVFVFATIPTPRVFKSGNPPVRFTCRVPCEPPSARLSPVPTVKARLLGSVGSLLAVRKLCVWTGDPASAAVVV